MWYDTIYLTAIGLTPGDSSTVHINTQTIHRTTQSAQTIHRTTQLTNKEECGPCPVFASYNLAFALQLRKKHGKTSVRVAGECQLAKNIQNRTFMSNKYKYRYNNSLEIIIQDILPLLTALWKRKKWRCSKTSTHYRLIQLIRMAKTGSPLACSSLANSCTCSSIMSYQQNHYK